MDLKKLAIAQCPVLITGPTGVGKSYLAEKIHEIHRPGRPFIEVDTAALHRETFDSQLFGHRKGSFTGAIGDRMGLCRMAKDGTLFLDEIGGLGLDLQKKLLMLMEKRSFLPMGHGARVPFEGTFILASNRDLASLVERGDFREDLYYRICVIEMKIKALCERRGEFPEIMGQLISQLQTKYRGKTLRLSEELQNFMLHHPWPGNIRQLKNVLEYLLVFAGGEAQMSDLPHWMNRTDHVVAKNFQRAMEDFERQYFTKILRENNGRINQTSREIGISKSTLITKARKYKINTHLLRAKIVV